MTSCSTAVERGRPEPGDRRGMPVEVGPGVHPRHFFQRVPESKTVKNRVHLDLRCADLAAEGDRLVDLGARVEASYGDHVTLADPEGKEFCVSAQQN